MKHSLKPVILFLLLIPFFIGGCETDDADPRYKLKVMGTGGSFSGYFSVDGDDNKYFTGEEIAGTVYYSYEKSISSLESILVSVTAEDTDTTAISIYLYSDSELIERADASQTDAAVKVSLTLDYSETDTE